MVREVFRRPGKGGNDDLSVAKLSGPRSELLEPGSYDVVVDEAWLIASRGSVGNISVVLKLHDADTGTVIDTRPAWIAGPNAGRGPMAARNQAIISDLLSAAGIEEADYTAFTSTLLTNLVGKTFAVELSIDRGKLAASFNSIVRVDGLVVNDDAPSVLPFKSAAAAD
jgi:hypothetical protein